MLSFTERMQRDKDLAQDRRNRGQQTTTHKSWNYKRPPLTGLDAIEAYYHQWRKYVSINAYLAVEYALFTDNFRDLAREIGL